MKIAIATSTQDENSQISGQAGRAPYYQIFDESGKLLEAVKNPFMFGSGGAGFGVAKMLADKGVNLVIAGDFGPNMISALEDRSLRYEKKTGVVGEIVKQIIK